MHLKNKGLTLVFAILFIITLAGQVISGLKEYNKDMNDTGGQPLSIAGYVTSGHFLSSTFENWESEFLQMALYVVLPIFLYQKGSSESKDPDAMEDVDKDPDRQRVNAPWPVKKGGWILEVYKHSLSIVLFIFFALSFLLHWYGSMKGYNQEQSLKNLPTVTAGQYLSNSRFWFESFQNWQSEFLSIVVMVILTVYLRQIGSPMSKPLDTPYGERS
ncbi:MAG TPA: DUF6766 family protein [Chitinophagaceae bacterium]|nr:DUF6766 family protein [Chitinophagaceae bacterium]